MPFGCRQNCYFEVTPDKWRSSALKSMQKNGARITSRVLTGDQVRIAVESDKVADVEYFDTIVTNGIDVALALEKILDDWDLTNFFDWIAAVEREEEEWIK